MRQSRRSVLASLGLGALGGTGLLAVRRSDTTADSNERPVEISDDAVTTMVALSEVIYPSSVTVSAGFVRGYVGLLGRWHQNRIQDAVEDLDIVSRSTTGRQFSELTVDRREAVLRTLGVGSVTPDPTGTASARVRYYLCNGLLLALFTAPDGTRLFGIDNPLGYPGGYHGAEQLLEEP